MEYRPVVVKGVYLNDQQTSWRNQVYHDQIGVSLLTPLVISGTDTAVLVNRGCGRELPIQPNYFGVDVLESPNEHIDVLLKEKAGRDEVVLEEQDLHG